uniref:Uncharacterized protein n=1 Tax=Phytophthora ramorum TaxID=164328 RepID=H3HDD4_PHYRM
MIYPSTSVSQHVQFGDPSSSFPTAYELVASTTTSVTCVDAQLCLELQISSVFDMDPFFLHRYDTNTPLVSATFEGYDAKDILPLIPGRTDGEPTRSQRLSARDQLLVQLHFQSVDSRTATSAIQVYSVYGSQRVTHTTRRVDANTIRVALSITRNTEKSDVSSSDVYPLAATTLPDMTPTTSETNNVNLTIVVRDIRPSVNEQQTFAYSASASYLDMFLRSFVLQQAAEVSALVEAEANDPSRLQISLIYSNALMLKSVAFNTAAGSVDMIEDVPARAVIEYPASSSRPALDTILGELRERLQHHD